MTLSIDLIHQVSALPKDVQHPVWTAISASAAGPAPSTLLRTISTYTELMRCMDLLPLALQAEAHGRCQHEPGLNRLMRCVTPPLGATEASPELLAQAVQALQRMAVQAMQEAHA